MIELKVQCDCGQKFKFDVEPVNNQMPFLVNCPICGADGTGKANGLLLAQAGPPPMATAAAIAAPAQLRVTATAPAAAAVAPPITARPRMAAGTAVARPFVPGARVAIKDSSGPTNLGMGLLGAIIGAAIGSGLMYGFFMLTDFRFPLMGTGTGALTGLGARILFKGTDSALGAISGGIAAVAVIGTLYAMYGEFPIFNIISVIVSISIAYKVAS